MVQTRGGRRRGHIGRGGHGGRCTSIGPSTTQSEASPSVVPHVDPSATMEAQAEVPSSASDGLAAADVNSEQGSKVRGIICGHGARKAMRSAKRRLTVQFDFSLMQAICNIAECFNNEVGYIVRKYCSLEYKDWRLVPSEVRVPLRHKLLILFDIDIEDPKVQKVIDGQMQKAWKGHKFKLHDHFKEIGGEDEPDKAKSMRPDEVSKKDWHYLCNYWIDPKYLERAQKNIEARKKRKWESRNGSKSTARHHVARGVELDSSTGQIETWRLCNWNPEYGWKPPELEDKYVLQSCSAYTTLALH